MPSKEMDNKMIKIKRLFRNKISKMQILNKGNGSLGSISKALLICRLLRISFQQSKRKPGRHTPRIVKTNN